MIVAYLRVSTNRQHLANQRAEIKKYAESKGMVVNKWVMEVASGKTGQNERRLGETLRQLKEGDVLIVTELSRVSRSMYEIMGIVKLCTDNAVEMHCTKDGYMFDNSISSTVLSFAFGIGAELEHNLNSLRTREAMLVRKAQGKHMGRPPGSCPKMNHLMAHKQEVVALLEQGASIRSIYERFGISYETFRKFKKRLADEG